MATIRIEIDTGSSAPSVGIHSGGILGSRATPLTQGIGILSSILYDARMTASFNAGLAPLIPTPNAPPGSGQVYIAPVLADLTYHTNKIQAAIQQFNADDNIGLIVTFGGNVTCSVAGQYATKPFISLIGGLLSNDPTPPTGFFAGAVSLNSFGMDADRITDLVNNKPKVGSPDDIWLLYDPRSLMAAGEVNNFGGGGATPATNGISDPTKFGSDFDTMVAAGAKAIIISAAPYFHKQRYDLIGAANKSGLYICYPLLGYRNANGTNQPTKGMATLLGPDLVDGSGNAYGLMGAMASTVLSGNSLSAPLQSVQQKTVYL
jgi:hypothetical protein